MYNYLESEVFIINNLVGNPRKIFKIIYKRYNHNNLINSDEIRTIFPNTEELEEDLTYLHALGLIDHDYDWNYNLTAKGRIYFKIETITSFEIVIKSILCPIIVAFITTLITLWLKGS